MFVTPVLLALVSVGQVAEMPVWKSDYTEARLQAVAQKKPLVVVLGTGAKGLEKVVRGGMNEETRKRLATDFVCVYIDTNSAAGKAWAAAFEIVGGQGVVVSDRVAKNQTFWKQGAVDGQEFAQHVQAVTTASRTSFYPADSSPASVLGGSTISGSTFGATLQGGSSSYCPNCNNGGGRFRR